MAGDTWSRRCDAATDISPPMIKKNKIKLLFILIRKMPDMYLVLDQVPMMIQ